ncbi:hypothetical protein AC578_4794 [Pseudocercospora eumusae]|uniref:Uncharacterized protein n=1 Tax=Pseudocercospora eumusae TaxID=321146 RepID=A0A139HLF8_9PEZI|nr:hypothetical protein AC578_4794 [Pseudocercospora eumusae]
MSLATRWTRNIPSLVRSRKTVAVRTFATTASVHAKDEQPSKDDQQIAARAQEVEKKSSPSKTQNELDEELMRKLAGISGDGGESGVEYEDGKPVAMKRGVKNNMFRLI